LFFFIALLPGRSIRHCKLAGKLALPVQRPSSPAVVGVELAPGLVFAFERFERGFAFRVK
jgi:hypothetical protein